MRRWYFLLALVLGLGIASLATLPGTAAEKADPERIAKLIEQLGSGTFDDREKATEQLDAIGAPALEALKKATQSKEEEVKRRAEELVKKIEKRAEADKILQPKRVTLKFKDTPVTEAVAEFQKQSGYNVTLHDPQKKLADRKVTFETKEAPFWEALDQFCEKADLVEATPQDLANPAQPGGRPVPIDRLPKEKQTETLPVLPPATPPAKGKELKEELSVVIEDVKAEAVEVVPQAVAAEPPAEVAPPPAGGGGKGEGIARVVRPPIGGGGPLTNQQIILIDGKPKALPTCYAGAARIRALPPGGQPMDGIPIKDNEMLLNLQASVEPKLPHFGITNVRIEKATDDNDQDLGQSLPEAGGGGIGVGIQPAIAPIRRPYPVPVQMGGQQASVRLKKGDKASKTIKELKGVMTAQVVTAPEAVITVENILKAEGETAKGADGGYVKVLEVSKEKDGTIKMKVEVENPPNVNSGYGGYPIPTPGGPGGIQIEEAIPLPAGKGGAGLALGGQVDSKAYIVPAAPNGLALLDDKGAVIPAQVTGVSQQFNKGDRVPKMTYSFTFKPGEKQGEPAKFVLSGSRTLSVEVPFTLKDVPAK
jgi:hypothetical protein